jgi:hypothetical protein
MLRIRDIAKIEEIDPVINLEDADLCPDKIINTFRFSEEINQILDDILRQMDSGKGRAYFLKGGRGSGKSHFETYLELIFTRNLPSLDKYPKAKSLNMKIIRVSLLRFPAVKSFESILQTVLKDEEVIKDRDIFYGKHFSTPTTLVIDELSDFLSSKSKNVFYEDVRTLNYLAEFARNKPFWIVAALQQSVEETGQVDPELLARLKDRFGHHKLTVAHIEDLIDQRVVIKNNKADEVIKTLFASFRKNYPNTQVTAEEFRKTYPLHPATVQFLHGLEAIYSASRGILQFASAEVHKIKDKKADDLDTLITADVIFDHFSDRIRELPDFAKLVVVYDYYKTHIREILATPDLQSAGLAAIKVLILIAISPIEKYKKDAKGIAEMLGKQMSTISPLVNYQMIEELVLDPLVNHQMFIKKDGFDYFIDPKIDEGSRTRAKIKAQREALSDRALLMNRIYSIVNLPQLPLQAIGDGKFITFTWQNSTRQCSVYKFIGEAFRKTDMDRALAGLNTNFDVRLILFSPFLEDKTFYQLIRDAYPPENLPLVVFWLARVPTDSELAFIESYVSKRLLRDEIPTLDSDLRKDESEFYNTVTKLYYEGNIITASGSSFTVNASGLSFDKLMSPLFDESLAQIHPRHHETAPKGEAAYVSTQQLNSLYSHFIKPGKISLDDAEKKGINTYITGLLKPMGLAMRKGATFHLGVEENNELVSFVLNSIRLDDSMHNLTATLKNGDWGLSDIQVKLLVASLICLGQLIGYRDTEPVELTSFEALAQREINRLKSGKGISPELISYIEYGRFIWGEVGEMPTPLTLRTMWESAKEYVRKTDKLLGSMVTFEKQYGRSPVFKKVNFDTVLIKRMAMFNDAITLTMPATAGIEKFLIYFKNNNDAEADYSYLVKLHKLFDEQFDTLSRCYAYLSDPSLRQIEHHPSLKEKKEMLLIHADEFFMSMDNFDALKPEWESFCIEFSNTYAQEHDDYYGRDTFNLKKDIGESSEAKTLKKISITVKAATFDCEWFQLQPEFEKLPDKCWTDAKSDLFEHPQCRCGYKMGAEPPVIATDLKERCAAGISNFVRFLHSNRERLESYILSVKNPVTQKTLSRLMALNIGKVLASVAIPLLTDEVLTELNNALSNGGWIVKNINIDDFVNAVRGRRFRVDDLKEIFFKWMGDPEEQAIIHIKDQNVSLASILKESIAKYGEQGERLALHIERELLDHPHLTISDFRQGDVSLPVFDKIKFELYHKEQLLDLLEKEDITALKKKIRSDIFHRAWGRAISDQTFQTVIDGGAKSLLSICKIYGDAAKYHGVEQISKTLAPMNLLYHRLKFDNSNSLIIDDDIVTQIENAFNKLEKEYAKSPEKFSGAEDGQYLVGSLAGTVLVFDGLRYDLWIMLREIILAEGWTVKEIPYVLQTPTTTVNFRQTIGIGESTEGHINGRSFGLFKWAEKDAGRKGLKQFLKRGEDIKILHFNFIDSKMHASTMDLYPLFMLIKDEFVNGVLPIMRDIHSFIIVSDHGFTAANKIKDRYLHGGDSVWERVLPFVEVRG